MFAVLLVLGTLGLALALAYLWGGVPGFPTWMQLRRANSGGRARELR